MDLPDPALLIPDYAAERPDMRKRGKKEKKAKSRPAGRL